MKNLEVSDKAGKIGRASRDIMRDVLADLGLRARITHRVGGHSDQYNGVAVSPDGSRLITASSDGTARLWDIASGQCLMVFRGHTDEVRKAAFMNDGERSVTAADDGTLRLWDCATGACILVLKGHTGRVVALAVSPDERYIASSSDSYELLVWSLPGGTCEHAVRGIDWPTKILVTGDGSTLLTLNPGRDIQRWSFPGLDNPSFIAQGDYWDIALAGEAEVVAAGGDGLSCFDARTGVRKRLYSLEPHKPYKVTTTSDETRFVTCCYPDHAILVLDLRTGASERPFSEHGLVMDMTLSPDGKTLWTVSFHGPCRIWDLGRGECLRTNSVTWNVHQLALSGNGRHLAACDKGETVKLWNLTDGFRRAVVRRATSVAFLERAGLVATGHTDGRVRFWDVESGSEEPVAAVQAYSYPVACLLPLGSGASFATFAYWGGPTIWDTEKRTCIRTYHIAGKIDIDNVAIDEATQRMAVRCHTEHNHILFCDLRSGDILARMTDHALRYGNIFVVLTCIRFLPQGKGLVSCGRDGLVILWDLSTFKAARSINVGCSILSMAVEHDGRHVVIGTCTGGVERWDLENGQREVCCPPEGLPVAALALSPDERRLYVSFSDGTVRIIDRESNTLLCSLWNVDSGFCWFTPPDEHAPDGWVWTDRVDLLHLVEESSEGKVLGAVSRADERRNAYVRTRNNAAMVRARLKGLDEYRSAAGRYARTLAGKRQEAIAVPQPLLPRGDGDA